ncbi:CaiB/BaiF CoA transferase family protein [Chloroflexota bacterium]
MKAALSGVRVLELAEWIAAPSASMILADWGADVIKIENPQGGDAVRGLLHTDGVYTYADFNQHWEFLNRNKKSIGLDVRSEEGKAILYQLVERADVFVTNFRKLFLEKLGYSYETISKRNPKIVYLSITGYGHKGPSRDAPAMDETAYWARSGIMSLLGEPDTPPPALRGAMGDLPTGMFAAGGVALALYNRERTGEGQEIEVSLLGSGIWTAGFDLQTVLYYEYDYPRESRKEKLNPLYNSYGTKDNRWIMFSMPQSDRYWPHMCKALGIGNLETDPRFSTLEMREQNNATLIYNR